MFKFDSWQERQRIDGPFATWRILAYPNIVSLKPGGNFDPSRLVAAGVGRRDALVQQVTPEGFARVYPVYPKQTVQISLRGGSVLFEPGAMHFMKGDLEMTLDTPADGGGIGGFFKRAATSIASGESMLKPRVTGTGDVFLEPTRKHLFLVELNDSTFICDQGLWVAADGAMAVDGKVNTLSAAANSGEGVVMPRVQGKGVVLIESPVPKEKIMVVELNDETLTVDGPYVMAFWGDIEFTTRKAAKGVLATVGTSEGYVNTYTGSGTLWIDMEEAGCFETDL